MLIAEKYTVFQKALVRDSYYLLKISVNQRLSVSDAIFGFKTINN